MCVYIYLFVHKCVCVCVCGDIFLFDVKNNFPYENFCFMK